MTPILHIRLFGGLQITQGETPVGNFLSNKVPALLAYLIVNPHPHQRDALAALLWGEMSDADAKNNLRQALSNLRKLLEPHLLINRDTVEWNTAVPYTLDVQQFNQSLQQNQTETAVSLYRGDFLAGFVLRDAPDFEEWMLLQRARFRERALHALHNLTQVHLERADSNRAEYGRVIDLATQLLTIDPWREEAYRQLMLALARSGQHAAALQQYETCRRLLEKELGVQPALETRRLYDRIQAASDPHRHNLPPLSAATTTFVGRQTELSQITTRLRAPNVRLLTLLGSGGSGKTRLAQEAAHTLRGDFADGIWYIPLVSLTRAADIPLAMATALGFHFSAATAPAHQLIAHLRPKELLLVCDNFEHLLADDAPDLLHDILQQAPDVRFLVTSQERLNLQAETLLLLEGLPCPPFPLPDPQSITNYAAAQLFLARVRQYIPDFDPGHTTNGPVAQAIAQLCHLVGGIPLALELAATWSRTLSIVEIVTEIQRSSDFLATTLRDLPARHRSMRVVCDYSWQRLTPTEQTAYRRQAIFRGGFSRQAAQVVAGTALSTLVGLVDKSFLRLEEGGDAASRATPHYRRHPILIQFALEKLQADPAEYARQVVAHTDYFAEFLAARLDRLKNKESSAFAEIQPEIENIRFAWRTALEQGRTAVLQRMLSPLINYYGLMGGYITNVTLTQEAISALSQLPDPVTSPERAALLGELYFWQGRMYLFLGQYALAQETLLTAYHTVRHLEDPQQEGRILSNLSAALSWLGRHDEADQVRQDALLRLQATNDIPAIIETINGAGVSAIHQGHYAAARQHFQQCYDLYRQHNFAPSYLSGPLLNLGHAAMVQGDYAAAATYFRDCLALSQQYQSRFLMGLALLGLGGLYRHQGNLAMARDNLEQALVIHREMRSQARVSSGLYQLAAVLWRQGEVDEAERLLPESLALAQATQNYVHIGYIHLVFAEVATVRQNWSVVRHHLTQGLQIALTQQQAPLALSAVSQAAEEAWRIGAVDLAVNWSQGIWAHPGADAADRQLARQRLRQLRGIEPEEIDEVVGVTPVGATPPITVSWVEMVQAALTWLEMADLSCTDTDQPISTRYYIGNRYVAETLIAQGGMGEVYRGRDTQTGQVVALKRLLPHSLTQTDVAISRFQREAEILRQLDHPNIVKIIDMVAVGSEYLLVMEYVPGGSLRDLLDRTPRPPLPQVLRLALELADALARTHHLGIVHRDLKPANVLLAADGTPRLTDFGIARLSQQQHTHLTQPGMTFGTAVYMSPEACLGEELDAGADIWSFAVLLYEMLAGSNPYTRSNFPAVLSAILHDSPPDLAQLSVTPGGVGHLPIPLITLLQQMLVKNREERLPRMRQVAATLEQILADLPSVLPTGDGG